jgi:hypothetical protein
MLPRPLAALASLASLAALASLSIAAGCSRDRDQAPDAGNATLQAAAPRDASAARADAAWRERVDAGRELLVTDPAVVGDSVRGTYRPAPGQGGDAAQGAWSFGGLIESLAGPEGASRYALRMLSFFEEDLVLDSMRLPGRPLATRPALARWLARSGCAEVGSACTLDLASAPFRLEAIASRLDLRRVTEDGRVLDAGEGRFIFHLEDPAGASGDMSEGAQGSLSLIFEYELPASNAAEVDAWARGWHELGGLSGEPYRVALQRLTDRFARAGRAVRLHGIRTSELGASPWELREFVPNGPEGRLELERHKHNGCAGCHLDRAEFEHVRPSSGGGVTLSRFLTEAELPRRSRDLLDVLALKGRDAGALRPTERVD